MGLLLNIWLYLPHAQLPRRLLIQIDMMSKRGGHLAHAESLCGFQIWHRDFADATKEKIRGMAEAYRCADAANTDAVWVISGSLSYRWGSMRFVKSLALRPSDMKIMA